MRTYEAVRFDEAQTVVIPATAEPFVAREKFALATARGVQVSFIGEDFTEWFLEKIEGPVVNTVLYYAKLMGPSLDGPIIEALGHKAETMLAYVYNLMECQPNGEDGALLTSGYANIFYIRDINGELRAVGVYWLGDVWRLHVHSVTNPFIWGGGRMVFFRNS